MSVLVVIAVWEAILIGLLGLFIRQQGRYIDHLRASRQEAHDRVMFLVRNR